MLSFTSFLTRSKTDISLAGSLQPAWAMFGRPPPEPSKIGEDLGDKWLNLEKYDRGAAEEWRALDRKRALKRGAKNNALSDMDREDEAHSIRGEEDFPHKKESFDWSDE